MFFVCPMVETTIKNNTSCLFSRCVNEKCQDLVSERKHNTKRLGVVFLEGYTYRVCYSVSLFGWF